MLKKGLVTKHQDPTPLHCCANFSKYIAGTSFNFHLIINLLLDVMISFLISFQITNVFMSERPRKNGIPSEPPSRIRKSNSTLNVTS